MNPRLVALRPHVKPLKSIWPKTRSHLTPLESHSCDTSRSKLFRITFLRKNRGGGGHPVNHLPEMEHHTSSSPLFRFGRKDDRSERSLFHCFFTSPSAPAISHRVGGVGPDDTDAVIEEGRVDGGDFDLRHVAGDAVGFCLRADFRRGLCGGILRRSFRGMTREAFRVVGRGVLIQLFVGIVARDAGKARVALRIAPALAVLEAVRLEADVHHAAQFLIAENHVGPRAVAGPAEIDRRDRIEFFWIENRGTAQIDFARLHRDDVIRSGAVAGFALHAGSQVRRVKMAADV
jgi:hypothetical protein